MSFDKYYERKEKAGVFISHWAANKGLSEEIIFKVRPQIWNIYLNSIDLASYKTIIPWDIFRYPLELAFAEYKQNYTSFIAQISQIVFLSFKRNQG